MSEGTQRCIFCDEAHNEGIFLHGKFICANCQEDILNIDVNDPEYDTYKEGIKVVWNFSKLKDELERELPGENVEE